MTETEKKSYPCEHCKRIFWQKNDYIRHVNKKYPCVTKEQLKDLKDDELIDLKEKMTETDALKFLESFFNKIKDLLRDQESITSDRALDVITDFLFLRLLNYEMENNENMDFVTKVYNKKVKISNYDYEIDEYKKYFKWSELMKLIELIDKDSSNQENKQLLVDVISHIIFGGIFKFNEHTREIYKNRRFFIKKFTTIQRLIKEFNKIDFTKYNVDIKGKAYEMTLQKESVTNSSFGQYFTPTWIDKYMVSNANIKINKNGSYTKILDPACGTAGILCEYYAEVKKRADKDKIKLDKNVSNYIYGCEIVDDTLKLAHMNMLLKSGSYNTNLKNIDFLEVECLDYVDEKLDANIIMNPPFALTKKYHLYDDDESKKIFFGETKSGTMLFLMAGLSSIKDGNQLIMVSQNGKEIFSKNKEFVNIRKKVMEKANIFKIAILPDASFKPYTSVQTLILMMEKGKKTDEIEFVKLEKDKEDNAKEIKLCSVKFKDIEKKNYTWNYKDYYVEKAIEYKNLKYLKLSDVLERGKSGKTDSGKITNTGEYNFYSATANNPSGTHNNYDFDGEKYFIFSKSGGNSKTIFGNSLGIGKFWLINGKSCGNVATIQFFNKTDNNIQYIDYFLKYHLFEIQKMAEYCTGNGNINVPDMLEKIKIPIPPIEVQNLIVKELDSYYKIKESNQNILDELEVQRKGKFELLLDLSENKKKYLMEEVCEFKNGKSITKENLIDGKYPVIGGGQKPMGYHDEYNTEKNTILCSSSGAYAGFISRYKIKVWSSDCFSIKPKTDELLNDYLFYFVKSQQDEIYKLQSGTAQPHVYSKNLEKMNITIPSPEDQEAIIKEMEYFDNLKEMYQTHIINTEKQIKERFEYHLSKCKNAVPKDTVESKEDNTDNVDSETEDDEEEKIVKRTKTTKSTKSTKSSKSKKDIVSDSKEEKPIKKNKSTKSKVEKELETDTDTNTNDEKPIKKSCKK